MNSEEQFWKRFLLHKHEYKNLDILIESEKEEKLDQSNGCAC